MKHNNYNIVASTQAEKYRIFGIIRAAGAKLTGCSGYGSGYYIQLDATEKQVEMINNMIDMEE